VESKGIVQEEIYSRKLSTDKLVNIRVVTLFRWGCFTIALNKNEKEKIMSQEEVIINDYEYELNEMDDTCSMDMYIDDEENLSQAEKEEIDKTTEELNEDKLEEEGWNNIDTRYIMYAPIQLELE
jgi:hypothetical protein